MANTEVGSAYVTIFPKTSKNFSKDIGRQIDKSKSGISTKAVALGNLMSNAITGAVTRAASAATSTLSDAFFDYARYEQLVGGVDKLFGDASGQLQEYAAQAYKTSGLSANQYMEQATSFSAALISSLGGDTEKAADLADVAMRSMADNVNVFGSDMESVQNAFQGFAKQNYTMLDNLKLGYGGTKTEMERLIKDAASYKEAQKELNMTVDEGSMSFDNIVKAIQVVQKQQGIAGTTQQEAAETLEGSLNMTKAAWENFLTSLALGPDEIREAADELLESLSTLAENAGKYVGNALTGIMGAIGEAFGIPSEDVEEGLQGIRDEFSGFAENIRATIDDIDFEGFAEATAPLQEALSHLWDYIDGAAAGQGSGPSLADTINALQIPVAVITGLIGGAIELLVDLSNAFDTANEALGVFFGDLANLPTYVQSGLDTIAGLPQAFADGCAEAWQSVQDLLGFIGGALGGSLSGIFDTARGVVSSAWGAITGTFSSAVGRVKGLFGGLRSLVGQATGIFNGVKNAMTKPIEAARNLIGSAIGTITGIVNGAHLQLPQIKVPHFRIDGGQVPWGIGGKGHAPSIRIDWYAQGGFVDGATLIGAGEAGPEMILPKRGRLMDQFAEAIASRTGSDGGGVVVNLSYNGSADPNELVGTLTRSLRQLKATGAI